jgi:hypothetical protein
MSDTATELAEINRLHHSMTKFDKLGGSDTFMGRMYVFEEMLKEKHDAAGEGHEKGMYSYHGMNQYGNIVTLEPSILAIQVFIEELGYTEENLTELQRWYEGRTVDCVMMTIYIQLWQQFDGKVDKILEKADAKSAKG